MSTPRPASRRFASWLCTVAVAALALTACSESKTADGTDAGPGITFDAGPDLGPPDLGPDLAAPPSGGSIGAACTDDTECSGDGQCAPAPDFPGGYCTQLCGDTDCPTGSACTPIDGMGTMICLDECDPAAAVRQCRMGYGCAQTMFGPAVCVPGCTDDTDCTGGTVCDPTGGFAGSCYSPDASIGDACTDDAMCPAGGFCFAEDFGGWPGGACIGFGCDAAANTGCPAESVCIPGRRGGLCVADCATDGDCRTGYRCAANPSGTDTRYCAPLLDARDVGQPCSSRDGVACAGGSCLREVDTGYPGSYCALNGCTPGATDTGCPGDTLCVADGTTNRCLDACAAEADCRDGYACTPVDATSTGGPSYCKPACTMNVQCVNDGATCNTMTGLCTPPP
jgi:hypothetical protein